jgi:DNA-binding NarL/FixJ family response regulator
MEAEKDPLCEGEIKQVVRLTNDGLTNDEIADIMGISRRQIQHARRQLGIQSLVPRGKTRRGYDG